MLGECLQKVEFLPLQTVTENGIRYTAVGSQMRSFLWNLIFEGDTFYFFNLFTG